MLPLTLLRTAISSPVLVELKSGETYNGRLTSCDAWMNLNLNEVIFTSADGDRFFKLPQCYIRGSAIKYMRMPPPVLEQAAKEEAESQQQYFQNQNQPHHRGGGGRDGRGRGGSGRGGRGAGRGGRGRESRGGGRGTGYRGGGRGGRESG